jgi:hypothetical protein
MVSGTNYQGEVVVRFLFIFLLLTTSAFAADGDPVLVPGSTEITTLGTIGTGTWEATTIETPYGGTGQTTYTDGQLLIGDTGNDTLQKNTIPDTASINVTNGAGTIQLDVLPGGVDHGGLAGLADDDHPGHPWSAGRTGNLTLYGSIDASGNLILRPTTHATLGVVSMPDASASAGTSLDMAGNIELGDFDLAAYDFPLQRGALKAKLIGGLGVHRGYIVFQTPSNLGPALAFIDNAGTNRAYWQQVGTDKSFLVVVNNTIQRMRFYANGEILIGPSGSTVKATVDLKSYFTTQPALLVQGKAAQTDPLVEFQDSAEAVIHSFALPTSTDPTTYFNQNSDDIDTIIKTVNVADAFKVDAGTDSVQTNTGRQKKTTRIEVGATPYAVLATDHVIYCDTDGGAIEVDLPVGTNGRELRIINVGSSGNDCTIDPNGAEQLYGGGAGVAFALHDSEIIVAIFETTENWW